MMSKKKWVLLSIVCLLLIVFVACADSIELGDASGNDLKAQNTDGIAAQPADSVSNENNDTTEQNSTLLPSDCEYCGKLDDENRWFIAKVIDSQTVMPIGEKCFEAVSAGDAGFILDYFGDNLIEQQGLVAGDIVRVTYNGYVVETYPCQITPISIEPAEQQ